MSDEPSDDPADPATQGGRGAPRTLAEELRSRDDAALAALLRSRPDLLSPVPGDLTQLATRAGTRASVVRAVERLDRFTLQTAEALAVAPDPGSYTALAALLAGPPPDGPGAPDEQPPPGASGAGAGAPPGEAELRRALRTLRERALLWGDDDHLRLVRTARQLLAPSPTAPSPTGLGPTLAEATGGTSPGRLQELLAAAGLPGTADPVSAVTALTGLFGDRRRMAELLATAPPAALAILGRLEWGPPYGTVDLTAPSPPVAWLLDRGLLVPSGEGTVVLPREVALHLRAGRAHRRPEPTPPAVAVRREYPPETVDATGAGQAHAALATVEELLGAWETEPPPVLRAGGLGVRELRRTASSLDTPVTTAAFWIELAYAAGLLASDGEADERYAPTPAYDEWLRSPAELRWTRLADTWLTGTRVAGLVSERDAKGRTLTALGAGLDRSLAPEVRRRALRLLAALPPGAAPDPASLLARLAWEQPLRGGPGDTSPEARGAASGEPRPGGPDAGTPGTDGESDPRTRIARWTLEEAELLGVTGRGALTRYARELLTPEPELAATGAPGAAPEPGSAGTPGTPGTLGAAGEPGPQPVPDPAPAPDRAPGRAPDLAPGEGEHGALTEELGGELATTPPSAASLERAARALAPLLPEPLDYVLLQADLTAVAPGPLTRELSAVLGVLAEVESTGGATVYRFTPASVRRALDAGRAATDLHAFLTAHSRTPVPQPLSYLIDDVARRHGHLRVGAASSYLRCDDDALLAEILADRRAATLGLRLLAPTVLASHTPPDQLLTKLREMGYAPAAESAEGTVLVARPDAHRTPRRTPPQPVPDGPPTPDRALLTAAVRAIRAGDRAATVPHEPPAAPAREGGQPGRPGPHAPRRPGPGGARPRPTGQRLGELPRTTSAETLTLVREAARTGAALWIGYVNAEGSASQRVIAPVRVEGGFVTAYDHTSDAVRTYPLHRITGAADLPDQ
ncbi:DNA-binding protein [Streptomyces sp. AJS327]|uniref:helicase-associated domain-containing protein n=1 Tax=Streptomyces sp. AJS327 TaxID=2545265 RepID=UPI0015DE4ED7|nr:helicase-associated domain-containing protein [Streptomyces sp. AJS327]MBA0053142.1 DNA-binding protein [Streptomyces sp. AJS327]